MDTKHTPGKWEVWAELNVQAKSGRPVCSCGVNNGNPKSREENIANAKLIAAAPELLGKMEQIYNDIKICESDNIHDMKAMLEQMRSLARSAIYKATGN